LGLICSIWIIPRFETFGTFLLIVFCVHGLAAWIAVGREQISYMGLQVALAFDLGFLQGYGPPENIDPLRDRFIGIVIGICIVTIVFALLWPESADLRVRERLAACLRTIARLLRLAPESDDSQKSSWQREQLELEIASRLSEANSYEEEAAFEALLEGSKVAETSHLAAVAEGVEEIYVASLPWLRDQTSSRLTSQDDEHSKTERELTEVLTDAMEQSATVLEEPRSQTVKRAQLPADLVLPKRDASPTGRSTSASLEELIRAVVQMQLLVQENQLRRAA
jgi:uncharacterized membrane protein YccC